MLKCFAVPIHFLLRLIDGCDFVICQYLLCQSRYRPTFSYMFTMPSVQQVLSCAVTHSDALWTNDEFFCSLFVCTVHSLIFVICVTIRCKTFTSLVCIDVCICFLFKFYRKCGDLISFLEDLLNM